MLLRLLILTGLLALVPAIRAGAQVSPSPDDARRTLEVLQDPQKRDQLLTTLRTIAQSPAARPPPRRRPPCRSPRQSWRRGADGRLRAPEPHLRRGDRRLRSGPQRAATVVLAAGDGDRPLVARRPAGHGLAPGAGAGGRPRGRVGGAPRRYSARSVALVRQAPNGDTAGRGRRRGARRKRRDRSHPAAAAIVALTLLRRVPLVLGRSSSNCCRCLPFCWSAIWSRRPRLAARIGRVSCCLP